MSEVVAVRKDGGSKERNQRKAMRAGTGEDHRKGRERKRETATGRDHSLALCVRVSIGATESSYRT